MGGQRQGDIPVFFQTQRGSRTPLGNPEGKPQENDLSEDGSGFAQLRQNWRGEKDQEEADVPVQRRGAGEESFREKSVHLGREGNVRVEKCGIRAAVSGVTVDT